MKKWIIIGIIVLAIIIIAMNWTKIKGFFAKKKQQRLLKADGVALSDTDAVILALQEQLALANSGGGSTTVVSGGTGTGGGAEVTVTAPDLQKEILILKIQKAAQVVLPTTLIAFLRNLSLADLTMISTMNKAELTSAYSSYF